MDTAAEGKDPSAFLGEIIGAPVTVKLNSGVIYKGQTDPAELLDEASNSLQASSSRSTGT